MPLVSLRGGVGNETAGHPSGVPAGQRWEADRMTAEQTEGRQPFSVDTGQEEWQWLKLSGPRILCFVACTWEGGEVFSQV